MTTPGPLMEVATAARSPIAGDDGQADGGRRQRRGSDRRRWWTAAFLAAVVWSAWSAGIGHRKVVNDHGWPLFAGFWRAAVHPDVSRDYLWLTARETVTTLSYAVLGTGLSVVLGLTGGVLCSETWWRGTGRRRRRARLAWYTGRLALGVPRGVHEATWCLLLLSVLGRDPLVAVLALAIPFGAITAKVYSELIDEAAHDAYDGLLEAGSGRLAALAYAILPATLPDLVSYAFYRFECSVRSAVIFGMIGVGGLGFQLSLSFQALAYPQMWTLIYAVIAVSAGVDQWGASLRRRPSRRRTRVSLGLVAALGITAVVHLGPDLTRLFAGRTWQLLGELARESWPPTVPDGWGALLRSALETVQMSLLAIALGSGLAAGVAFLAVRSESGKRRGAIGLLARLLLLVARAIPPPVWALLLLFVIFPGPLPGALALGIYNFGILGRLFAEVVENVDPRPAAALRVAGAGAVGTLVYATVPMAAGKFTAYALYRWEIAIRETVVVGLVGAGGLGRMLEERRAGFDYPAMLAILLTLIVLSVLVDLLSSSARRSLR
jgi:phosphonate transport system permease protein